MVWREQNHPANMMCGSVYGSLGRFWSMMQKRCSFSGPKCVSKVCCSER